MRISGTVAGEPTHPNCKRTFGSFLEGWNRKSQRGRLYDYLS
jgi:hypothetical protein